MAHPRGHVPEQGALRRLARAFSDGSLFGRCTRGYVAIEKEIKDDNSTSYTLRHLECEAYKRLAPRRVSEYIPTCLGGEYVSDERGIGCYLRHSLSSRPSSGPSGSARIAPTLENRPHDVHGAADDRHASIRPAMVDGSGPERARIDRPLVSVVDEAEQL
ncbi:hypothetical protein V8D89_004899 [Ganoderma adspersum]